MPIIALEVPETYDSITRPVNIAIIRDLIDRLNLPNNSSIRYAGSAEALAQHGSLLANKSDSRSLPFGNRVDVEVEEEYIEEGILNTAIKKIDNMVVFLDDKLKVSLRPVYTKTRTTISFRYKAQDRNTAIRWRDSIRNRTSEGKQAMLHEVMYHYSVPDTFFAILKEIHLKRESIAGYNEEFEKWLTDNFTDRLTTLSNLSGTQGLPVISEKQIGVQGWFNFVAEPDKAEKQGEGGNWEVGFDYTYTFDKVTAVTMDYPIIVHNQLLDYKYLPDEKPYDFYDQPRRPSFTGHLNEYFSPLAKDIHSIPETAVIPNFDNWKPEGVSFKTHPLISTLIGVDLDDPTLVVNLRELGELELSEEVLEYLSVYCDKVNHYLALPFHITFFKGNNIQSSESIIMDDELNIRTTTPMNLRDVHHLRFSLLMDLRLLSRFGSESLRKYPELCKSVVDLIAELQGTTTATSRFDRNAVMATRHKNIKSRPGQTNGIPKTVAKPSDELILLGGKIITEPSFNMAIAKFRTDMNLSSLGRGKGLKTVMEAGILTHRRVE